MGMFYQKELMGHSKTIGVSPNVALALETCMPRDSDGLLNTWRLWSASYVEKF